MNVYERLKVNVSFKHGNLYTGESLQYSLCSGQLNVELALGVFENIFARSKQPFLVDNCTCRTIPFPLLTDFHDLTRSWVD